MACRVGLPIVLIGGLMLVGASVGVGRVEVGPATATPVACPFTAPRVPPPSAAVAAPAGTTWYAGNALWVGLDPSYGGRWDARPDGLKVFWVRQARGTLTVTGRRLDAPAAALKARILSGYGDIGLQISGLTFPTAGCWQIDGRAGTGEVRIVVAVEPAPAPESRASPVASPAPEVVAIDDLGVVRLIDPVTGTERWRGGEHGAIAAAVAGPEGVVFVSVADPRRGTDVFAVPLAAGAPEPIGHVAGIALTNTLSTAGDRLLLVDGGNGRTPDGLPTGVSELPLPDRWRGAPTAAAVARRDDGGGILTPDGRRWYGLWARPEGTAAKGEVLIATFDKGGAVRWSRLSIALASTYTTLVLTPDGDLYVIEFWSQTIQVIDPTQPAVVRSVAIGRAPTKRPPCAAVLAPRGDRLYVLAKTAGDSGDGADVFDTATATWRRVAQVEPGRDFYCLALSAAGDRLYLTTAASSLTASDQRLVTVDTETGTELGAVPLTLDDCCPRPILATGSAREASLPPASPGTTRDPATPLRKARNEGAGKAPPTAPTGMPPLAPRVSRLSAPAARPPASGFPCPARW